MEQNTNLNLQSLKRDDIKKLLYRQKPKAILIKKINGIWTYTTPLREPRLFLDFEVPESDMGDAKFEDEMDAHLLIRWLKHDAN
jgi:hypothetical protein